MSDTDRCHILIFEPDARGHAREWIEHLVCFAAQERPGFRLTIAVPPALVEALLPRAGGNIALQPLSESEERRCRDRRLVVSSFARWRAMQRHLKRSGAEHGFFLAFDHLSLPLALGLRARRPVSGILFRPSAHFGALRGGETTLREKLRDARKQLLYRLMLRNPSLELVFSLDPYFPAYLEHAKLTALVDPAFPFPEEPAANAFDPPKERVVFVLFGELAERKGLLALLDALALLGADVAARIAILIAGRVEAPLRPAVDRRVARLAQVQPRLWLHVEDRFLSAAELADLVRRSDVVLAPYQRFVGSSGVMLWAASAGKPIITQDYGLLGRFTDEYKLGLAVDTTDPGTLADAITRAAANAAALGDPESMAGFVAAHTPHRFAATIFDGIASKKFHKSVLFPVATQASRAQTGHASPLR